eukprot:6044415-Pyramimonas_sp.AAC.1
MCSNIENVQREQSWQRTMFRALSGRRQRSLSFHSGRLSVADNDPYKSVHGYMTSTLSLDESCIGIGPRIQMGANAHLHVGIFQYNSLYYDKVALKLVRRDVQMMCSVPLDDDPEEGFQVNPIFAQDGTVVPCLEPPCPDDPDSLGEDAYFNLAFEKQSEQFIREVSVLRK